MKVLNEKKSQDNPIDLQATERVAKLDSGASERDTAFYRGKIAVASFFARNVLPELSAGRKIVESADNGLMELDEAAF